MRVGNLYIVLSVYIINKLIHNEKIYSPDNRKYETFFTIGCATFLLWINYNLVN